MNNKEIEAEIEAMRNNPEIMASILKGMHDCHLGHIFSSKLVFGALEGTGGTFRLYYRLIINLKKLWWTLKAPYQKYISHRGCPQCKRYNEGV